MSIDEMHDTDHIHNHYGFPLEIACTIPPKDYFKIAWHFFWHLAPRTLITLMFVIIPICFTLLYSGLSVAFGEGPDFSSLPYTGTFSLISAILFFCHILKALKFIGHTNSERGLKRLYYFDKRVVSIYENDEKIYEWPIGMLTNNFEKGGYTYFSSNGYGELFLFCIPTRRIPHDFYLFLNEDKSWESNHPIVER